MVRVGWGSERGHRLKSVLPQPRIKATLSDSTGAGPLPILNAQNETCLEWISFDVCLNLVKFSGRANPMIERFILPKELARPPQDFVRSAGGAALDQFGDPGELTPWLQEDMNMIGHHDIRVNLAQAIGFCFFDRFDDKGRHSLIA